MKKAKFYVVWVGIAPGIYTTWEDCRKNTEGIKGSKFKSYSTMEEANAALAERPLAVSTKTEPVKEKEVITDTFIPTSISVDAACTVTGIMEYRGVYTDTKEVIFSVGPYPDSTNNIGEFLAIVHALAHCKKNNLNFTIYSDSVTAMAWVRNKKINTNAERTERNKAVFEMMERAERWLQQNTYENNILKWHTSVWGEIAADYGRK